MGDHASGSHTRAAGLFDAWHLIFDQRPGSLHRSGEHPDTVDEQAAVGRMMNGGLYTGGVQAQLAPFGCFGLYGQFDHAVIERVQRPGTQRVLPAKEGGFIGDPFEVDRGLTSAALSCP